MTDRRGFLKRLGAASAIAATAPVAGVVKADEPDDDELIPIPEAYRGAGGSPEYVAFVKQRLRAAKSEEERMRIWLSAFPSFTLESPESENGAHLVLYPGQRIVPIRSGDDA